MKKTYFHATNEYFNEFSQSNDIGFHFGTKKAAMSRMKSIEAPDFEVVEHSVSESDIKSLEFATTMKNKGDRLSLARQQGFDVDNPVYHGSSISGYVESSDILFFNKKCIGDKWGQDESGFFFTNNKPFSDSYADSERDYRIKGTGNGVIYPVFTRSLKPMIVDKAFLNKEGMSEIGLVEDAISFWDVYHGLMLSYYEEGDYDSIILVDEVHKCADTKKKIEVRVVFESSQVRSIYSNFEPIFKDTHLLHEMNSEDYAKEMLIQSAYETLFPRLNTYKKNLLNELYELDNDQLYSVIDMYKNEPLSSQYEMSVERAEKGSYIGLNLNGVEIGRFESKRAAISFRAQVKKTLLKEVELSMDKSIRLPDLGVWTADMIARELSLPDGVKRELNNLENEQEKYTVLIAHLANTGYDSIVYENKVESLGSDSFIVFDMSQIKIIDKSQEYESGMSY